MQLESSEPPMSAREERSRRTGQKMSETKMRARRDDDRLLLLYCLTDGRTDLDNTLYLLLEALLHFYVVLVQEEKRGKMERERVFMACFFIF